MGFMVPNGRLHEETPARAAGSSGIHLVPRPGEERAIGVRSLHFTIVAAQIMGMELLANIA